MLSVVTSREMGRVGTFVRQGNVTRQRRILLDALDALQTMTTPGEIRELPYQWKRPDPN